jgi:Fe-S cluster assembly iron-binding protein IscA
MNKTEVDTLPVPAHFLTVTDTAAEEIRRLGENKPTGAFRVRLDILAQKTDIYFEWDDVFGPEDYLLTVNGAEIVMDATSIAYILDEYTLNFEVTRFTLYKNLAGPVRHQQR